LSQEEFVEQKHIVIQSTVVACEKVNMHKCEMFAFIYSLYYVYCFQQLLLNAWSIQFWQSSFVMDENACSTRFSGSSPTSASLSNSFNVAFTASSISGEYGGRNSMGVSSFSFFHFHTDIN